MKVVVHGFTFEKWLEQWADEITQAQEFTKSSLPTIPAEIQKDLSRTTAEYPRMAELAAEVNQHLIQCRAQETLSVKKDQQYAGLTADERKAIVEGNLADIIRVRDILKATVAALHERSFALMNQRNYARAELGMAGKGD